MRRSDDPGSVQETGRSVRDLLPYLLLALVMVFISLSNDSSPLSNANPNTDSGVFIYIGNHILQGQMPYLDIFDHKGPLLYLINASAILLSDRWGLWLLELLFTAAAAFITYATCRRFARRTTSLLATVLAYLLICRILNGGNYAEQFSLPFIALTVFCFTSYFTKGRIGKADSLLIGFGAGCVFLLKMNLLAPSAVLFVGIIVLYVRDGRSGELVEVILLALCGVLVIVVPILLWLMVRGACPAFIDDYFRFNSEYIGDTRSLVNVLGMLAWIFSYPVIVLGAVASVWTCAASHGDRRALWVCVLVTILVTALITAMEGNRYVYYLIFWPALLALPVAAAFEDVLGRCGEHGRTAAGVGTAVVAVLCALCMLPGFVYGSLNIRDYNVAFSARSENQQGGIVRAVLEYSSERDTIICYDQQTWLYDVTGRNAATKYIFQPEEGRLWIKQRAIREDIECNRPELVVIPGDDRANIDADLGGLVGYAPVYDNGMFVLYCLQQGE